MVRWICRGTVAVADPRDPSQLPSRRKDRGSFSRHLVIDARCHCGRIHPHRRVGEDAGDCVKRIGGQWLPFIEPCGDRVGVRRRVVDEAAQ